MIPSKANFFFVFSKKIRFSLVALKSSNFVSSFSTDLLSSTNDIDYQEFEPTSSTEFTKKVPISIEEYKNLRKLLPSQPPNPHLLKVSILGEPNVGKSTLTNNLVKWKVCSVSRKVHTTRKKATAVLVEENKQIVFLDTPGVVSPEQRKKHFLEPSFSMDPITTIRDADIIAVVVDISNKYVNNRIPHDILEILDDFKDKKSILVLNKIDAMKSKSRIISLTKILTGGCIAGCETTDIEQKLSSENHSIENLIELNNKHQLETEEIPSDVDEVQKEDARGWKSFSKVFMVSALKNDGMNDLREYLLKEAKPKNWMYHDSTVTDQHPHEIAIMTVREKLLEYLPQEIPYSLNLKVAKWELLSTGCPKIGIKITCLNSRHRRFVIGPGGRHIAACADRARRTMREAFRKDVVLHLAVN